MKPVLRSSGLWDAVLRQLPSGLVVLKPVRDEDDRLIDYEVLAANTHAPPLLGLAGTEIVGRNIGELNPALRQRSLVARFDRIIQKNRAEEFEQLMPVNNEGRTEPGWYAITAMPADGYLIVFFSSINRRKAALMEAVRLMSADDLTGIGNRRLLKSHFWRRRQLGTGMSLIFLDLNGFKRVNDTYGHETGDEVLRIVAQRIKNSLRPGEIVARLGGDEFAVLTDTSDETAAKGIASRLRGVVRRTMQLGDISIDLDTSVGVAVYPGDGESFEALSAAADQRMYVDKQAAGRPAV